MDAPPEEKKMTCTTTNDSEQKAVLLAWQDNLPPPADDPECNNALFVLELPDRRVPPIPARIYWSNKHGKYVFEPVRADPNKSNEVTGCRLELPGPIYDKLTSDLKNKLGIETFINLVRLSNCPAQHKH